MLSGWPPTLHGLWCVCFFPFLSFFSGCFISNLPSSLPSPGLLCRNGHSDTELIHGAFKEVRMTGTQTLQVVHGLVTNMKLVMDGMQVLLGSLSTAHQIVAQ